MKKYKKILIICLLIIVSMIAIMAIILTRLNTDTQEETEDPGIQFESNQNGFQIVKDSNVFFSVMNSLSEYIQILSYNRDNAIETDRYRIESMEQQREAILSLLDTTYVNENDLSQDNLQVEFIDYSYNIVPISMKVRYDQNMIVYITNIYIEDIRNSRLEEKYYIIKIDNENKTFCIEPVADKINSIDDIVVKESITSIEKNQYNQYTIETVSIKDLVKIYMNQFKTMMMKYPDIVYNQYLDEEYKNTHFPSENDFLEYVEQNRNEIEQWEVTKYSIEGEQDETIYILVDQYENIYRFCEKGTMDYKVTMDVEVTSTENFTDI